MVTIQHSYANTSWNGIIITATEMRLLICMRRQFVHTLLISPLLVLISAGIHHMLQLVYEPTSHPQANIL